MMKKLDVEVPLDRILGACNPKVAWQAIGMEPRVGAMLPCNVIQREVAGGAEVSAINPVDLMQTIDCRLACGRRSGARPSGQSSRCDTCGYSKILCLTFQHGKGAA